MTLSLGTAPSSRRAARVATKLRPRHDGGHGKTTRTTPAWAQSGRAQGTAPTGNFKTGAKSIKSTTRTRSHRESATVQSLTKTTSRTYRNISENEGRSPQFITRRERSLRNAHEKPVNYKSIFLIDTEKKILHKISAR